MILHVAAGSPWWLFAAANLILFLHIAGGTLGIISGAVALLSRKGGRMHRLAGKVFLVSMLTMATIGAAASRGLVGASSFRHTMNLLPTPDAQLHAVNAYFWQAARANQRLCYVEMERGEQEAAVEPSRIAA